MKNQWSLGLAMFLTLTAVSRGDVAQTSRPTSVPATAELPAGDPRVTPVVLAYRKARPAVVSISAEKIVTVGAMGSVGGDPLEDIFPMPLQRRVPVQSLGSGVIIHPLGYIATNAHVVRKAEKVTVTLSDRKTYGAKIIATDTDHDLAVLKIESEDGRSFPALPFGRSDDLMPGETVIAIGNPLGLSNTLTTGVISATDRTLEFSGGVKYAGLIQTDAPINPGNSGGPLLNVNGQLIGINTAIRADAQNIGFAIPVDALADQLALLLDIERINRMIFGAGVVQRHGQAGDELYVQTVRKDTPASASLQAGDRLMELDGKSLRQMPEFSCAMLSAKGGQSLRFKIMRDGKEIQAEVKLREKPRPDGKMLAERMFGMSLCPVTPELAKDFRLSVDKGLVVTDLDAGGPAAKLGVNVKDVVFQVDRFFVTDLDDIGLALEDLSAGTSVRIGIVRKNVRTWAPIVVRSASSRPADVEKSSTSTKSTKEK